MTEQYLIDNGFTKVNIPHKDSDNGYDYYFYEKEICDELTLYSTDSVDVIDDQWRLSCWEIPAIKIEITDHYEQFIELMTTIICN